MRGTLVHTERFQSRQAQGVQGSMNIVSRRAWDIPESRVTPEHTATGRRAILAGSAATILAPALSRPARADAVKVPPPGRPLTDEKYATTYNNYYEFNDSKSVWRQAQKL